MPIYYLLEHSTTVCLIILLLSAGSFYYSLLEHSTIPLINALYTAIILCISYQWYFYCLLSWKTLGVSSSYLPLTSTIFIPQQSIAWVQFNSSFQKRIILIVWTETNWTLKWDVMINHGSGWVDNKWVCGIQYI